MSASRAAKLIGAFYMALSVFMFVAMNSFAKYSDVPTAEKVFFRMAFGVLAVFTLVRFGFAKMEFNNIRLLTLRGALGATAVLLYFHSIDHTTLGRAVFFQFTYLAWGTLFSWIFLHEPLGWRRLPAVVLAFAGGYIILVSGSGFSLSTVTPGDVSGVLCGITSGAAVTAVRASHRQDSTHMIFLFFATSGVVAGGLATMATGGFTEPTRTEWLVILVIGLTGTVGQLLFTAGYRYLDVAAAGSIAMAQAPASAFIGYLFFKEELSRGFVAGALCVLAGGLYLALTSGGEVLERPKDVPGEV